MFTDVTYRQPYPYTQSQFPARRVDFKHSQPQFLPPPEACNAPNEGFQVPGFQQAPYRSQQYSLSPQDALSTASGRPPQNTFPTTSEEHMLRRKTPHETLAAGYAATPRPSRPFERSFRRWNEDFPTAASDHYSLSNRSPVTAATTLQQRVPSWDRNHSTARSDKKKSVSSGWQTDGFQNSGLDSVLNQGPTPQYDYNLAGCHKIPSVLQPMWPPCLGPTSSNQPAPYGPYWPNGE